MSIARKLRIATACTVLMGVTWIFGVFAIGELTLTFQILFTVFNSLQGFFIFLFYCVGKSDLRKELRKCCYPGSPEQRTTTRRTTHSTAASKSRSSRVKTTKKVGSAAGSDTERTHSKSLSEPNSSISGSKKHGAAVSEGEDVVQGVELSSVEIKLQRPAQDDGTEMVTKAEIHTKSQVDEIEAGGENEDELQKSDAREIFHIGIENRGLAVADNDMEADDNEVDDGDVTEEIDAFQAGGKWKVILSYRRNIDSEV